MAPIGLRPAGEREARLRLPAKPDGLQREARTGGAVRRAHHVPACRVGHRAAAVRRPPAVLRVHPAVVHEVEARRRRRAFELRAVEVYAARRVLQPQLSPFWTARCDLSLPIFSYCTNCLKGALVCWHNNLQFALNNILLVFPPSLFRLYFFPPTILDPIAIDNSETVHVRLNII